MSEGLSESERFARAIVASLEKAAIRPERILGELVIEPTRIQIPISAGGSAAAQTVKLVLEHSYPTHTIELAREGLRIVVNVQL